MKYLTMSQLMLVSAVVSLPALSAMAASSPAVGRWNIVINRGDSKGYCWLNIQADGDKFKAGFQPEAGGFHDIDPPKVDADKVEFKANGFTYSGTIKGDTMTGTRGNDNNKQEFSAKRSVPRMAIAGRWTLKIEGREGDTMLILRERGDQIQGMIRPKGKQQEKPKQNVKGAVENGVLNLTIQSGEIEGTLKATVQGDQLEGELAAADGKKNKVTGRREIRWGQPIELFNGKDLAGWKPLGGKPEDFKWEVKDGIMWTPGGANIVSEKTFKDFKIHVEFRVPEHGNSGVYLRGRYEIQVADSLHSELGGSSCGAIYCRIPPTRNVSKPAGEWQTFDATLIGQNVTVIHNGETIIDHREIEGMTGGAIDNDDSQPGPIYLQGDHGKIEYRKIIITPVDTSIRG